MHNKSQNYTFHEELLERSFLCFVDCMMHWTVTYTLKLSDAVAADTVFYREKSASLWPAEYSMQSPQHQTVL
jgi:hypothetical protein